MLRLLIASVACFCIFASSAWAARPELSLQDDRVLTQGLESVDRASAIVHLQQLGVQRVRLTLRWDFSEPADGSYDFSTYLPVIDSLRAAGLKVTAILTGPVPAWHTADQQVGTYRPDPAAYGRFAEAAAQATAGRVDRFAIWNEPNWPSSLRPQTTAPRQYRALYSAAEPRLRAAAPGAEVLLGEMSPDRSKTSKGTSTPPLAFLRGVLGPKGRLIADGVSIHPYSFPRSPLSPPRGRQDVTLSSLSRLRRAVAKYTKRGRLATPRGRRPALHITEWAAPTRGRLGVSPAVQARYTRQALRLACRARVASINLYLLQDPADPLRWASGLIDSAGQLKPAYGVVQRWGNGTGC